MVDTETVTVNGNGTYNTPVGYTLATTGSVAGTYQWLVSYSGDANNNSVTGTLGSEPVTVQSATPNSSTLTLPGNITLTSGTPPVLKDSATLSGGFHETGTITFNLYAPGGVVPIDTENVSVSGNGTYTTPVGYTLPMTGTVTGTYQWAVTYSGDANNNPVASATGNEPVVVVPATLLISTTPTPGDVTLTSGSPPVLKDSATLTGGFHATGNLVFSLYAAGGVTPVYTETVTVSGNGTYTTPVGYTLPTSGTVIGTYNWVASFSGDPNNNPVTSASGSEPVLVHPANAGLGTNAIPGHVTLTSGSPPILTDSATLTGGFSPTGTIAFNLYAPGGLVPIHTEIVTASGNGTYTTPTGYTLPTTGTVTGTYQWVASYSGDSNNNPVASVKGNEPVVVSPASLLLSTTINPSDVTLSDQPLPPTISDSATLTGSYHATGTITFDLYGPDLVTILYTTTLPVNGDGTYTATFAAPPVPPGLTIVGTYNWVVSYSGDGNNNPAASPFGSESGTVHAANPSISTNPSAGQVTLSSGSPPILTDSATLAGGFQEAGTITFNLFAPGGVVPIDTEIVNVTGNGTYTTPVGFTLPTTGTVTGTYQWVASYSGDGNNNGAASARGDEPVVVSPASLLISTTINPSDVTLSDQPLPPTISDSATLTGSYHATGTITFDLYGPDLVTILYTTTLPVNGDGTYTATFAAPPVPPGLTIVGTYNWVVSYSGDGNNNPAASPFGSESGKVHAANPSISTNPSAGQVTLSSGSPPILTDSATLAGGFQEAGTITFNLFAPGGVVPIDTEIVNVTGNGTYTTPVGFTLPTTGTVTGTYQWVASYSGDGNNNGAASARGDEPVVVSPASLLLSTTINPSDVTLSDQPLPPTISDSATLTGSYHATGTITFDLYGPDLVTILYTTTLPVNGDGTYTATFAAPPVPPGLTIVGTYNWVVSYSGDGNNNPVASPFGSESGQVHAANPGIGTNPSPGHVRLSSGSPPILTDSATLAGGFQEAGTITFDLFAPGGVVPIDTEIVSVTGNETYTTPVGYTLPTTGAVTGIYEWVVTYGGDGNNNPVASVKGHEPVVVAPANLLISTTSDPTQVTVGTSPFNDSATLSAGFNPSGTITFTLFVPTVRRWFTLTMSW